MLGAVAPDAEIGGFFGFEFVLENLVAGGFGIVALATPRVGDAVAQEQQVDVATLGDLDELVVAGHPALVARGGLDGGVGAGGVFLVVLVGAQCGGQ